MGSILAADPDRPKVKTPVLDINQIEVLENEIDQMNQDLPELSNFILPGGHQSGR